MTIPRTSGSRVPSMRVTLYEDEIRELIRLLDNPTRPVSNPTLLYKMRQALYRLEQRYNTVMSHARAE